MPGLNKLYAAVAAAAVLLILCTVIYVQQGQMKLLQAELDQVNAVKATQDKAIENLRKDIASASQTCDRRVAVKDRAIKRLRDIDGLKPGKGKDDAETAPGADPVLDALNGMLQADR